MPAPLEMPFLASSGAGIVFVFFVKGVWPFRLWLLRLWQHPPQILTRIGSRHCRNLFRCALGDNLPTGITALRAEVDDPVGGFDEV